ncbi:MAG: methyltransferase type 11 [Nitrospiraceae bacterium]|nr:methyltransferase type 11 [Nitrospiraceae bacterium]|tara:strand:+ start:750 stop:1445 length:696 start_codon:yes stop_codon:yes gene_type:complete
MMERVEHRKNMLFWEKMFASRPWGRYPPEELIRFVSRTFGEVPDRDAISFLEVGCGPGANIWYLSREGYRVAGIDGSQTAISQARHRLQSEMLLHDAPAVDLQQGDFTSLPWADGIFDAVVDIEAVYANEMSVIVSCIAEIHRVLKRGGVFFGKMFGIQTAGHGTGRMIEENTYVDPSVGPCAGFGISHFFSEDELQKLFSNFSRLSFDWVHRTDHGRTVEVFEWLLTATK